ncbi:MAG: 6-phosphogluconolactonase [Actinomycetota bacterium]|nr:6-phosphogluconolactonase [Actinomycetota bacterium]
MEEAAGFAGAWLADRLREAIGLRGEVSLAVSGGSTAPGLFAALAGEPDVAWPVVSLWQVDERVAPDGDPDRNAGQLDALPSAATVHLMPVTVPDLSIACDEYAATLPEQFDVVHLGVGPDGHTASWPPGDPVAHDSHPVAMSAEYEGRRRMTLTPDVVNAATWRLVYVLGAAKADVVASWLRGDDSLPIGLVEERSTVVVLDPGAASGLPQ